MLLLSFDLKETIAIRCFIRLVAFLCISYMFCVSTLTLASNTDKNLSPISIKHDQRPTDLEYARMSDHAYDNLEEFSHDSLGEDYVSPSLPGLSNWEIFEVKKGKNDYQGVVFRNTNTRQIVVAHRGTDSREGFFDDIKGIIFNDIITPQKEEMYSLTQAMIKYAKKEKYDLSFTGHSLGAFLAELSVFFCHKDFNYPRVSAVTFESPGSKESLENLPEPNVDGGKKVGFENLDIKGYVTYPDSANTFNHHIGSVYQIQPVLDYSSNLIGLECLKQCHSISNIVKHLDNEKFSFFYMNDWPAIGKWIPTKIIFSEEEKKAGPSDDIKWNERCKFCRMPGSKITLVSVYKDHYSINQDYSSQSSLPLRHFSSDMQSFLCAFSEATDDDRQNFLDALKKDSLSELAEILRIFDIPKTDGKEIKFVVLKDKSSIHDFRNKLSKLLQDNQKKINEIIGSLSVTGGDGTIKCEGNCIVAKGDVYSNGSTNCNRANCSNTFNFK